MKGHGHEPYPILFDRTIAWDQKAPLLDATTVTGAGGGEGGEGGKPRGCQENEDDSALSVRGNGNDAVDHEPSERQEVQDHVMNAPSVRRHRWLAATAALVALLMSDHGLAADAVKPNIVFVLFDDMGWGQPQSYVAGSALRTPNLDRLAQQGHAVHGRAFRRGGLHARRATAC